MLKVASLWALLVVILCQLDAYNGNKLSEKQDRSTQTVTNSLPLRREHSKHLYDRWQGDAGSISGISISENDIDTSSDQQFHEDKYDNFECGRAVLAAPPNRVPEYTSSQSKYRPKIEIRMPRIIGGDETNPGEFPWTASIKLNGQPICGGSLIDRSWIITAAHCVVGYNPKNLTVRLGAYRIKDSDEYQAIEVPVSMFIVHKDYSMPRPFSNDIALLKLRDLVKYSKYIIPICLPFEDQVTTSTSSIAVNDYSNQFDTGGKYGGSNHEEYDDSAIVISTKMSDHEIEKCFNQLEQNYLNSIGMGSSEGPNIAAIAPVASGPITDTGLPIKPTSLPQPANNANIQGQPQPQPQQQQQGSLHISYAEMFDPILQPIKSQSDKLLNLFAPIKQQASVDQHFNHAGHESGSPVLHSSASLVRDEQPTSSQSFGSSLNPEQFVASASEHDYYSPTFWPSQRLESYEAKASGALSRVALVEQPSRVNTPTTLDSRSTKDAKIKLSRLPLSLDSELLKEIHSVGSGSMPSLNLALEQGDIVAIPAAVGDDPNSAEPPSSYREKISSSKLLMAAAEQQQQQQQQQPVDSSGSNRQQLVRQNAHNHHLNTITASDDHDSSVATLASGHQSSLADDPTKYSGLTGIVVGWGWIRELDSDEQQVNTKKIASVTLQKVRLPILRNKVCEAWFQSQSKKITLLPSQFCAGFQSGGKDACRGDSGGPMVIEDNTESGRYKLIGIVSAGIGCARPSLPGLYTRVASFLPWINSQVGRYQYTRY